MSTWRENREKVLALSVFTKLMRAAEAVSSSVHREIVDAKLTISQFGVLEALYHLGPMCQKDIAGKILKSCGNITMVIDNLEKRNLVLRTRKIDDRRYYEVTLTNEGHRLIESLFPPHADRIARRFSTLDDAEMRTLATLLRKIGKNESTPMNMKEADDDNYNKG